MKTLVLGIAAAILLTGGGSLAQTTQPAPSRTAPLIAPSQSPNGTATSPAGSAAANGSAGDHDRNAAAASGNNNQAVATTSANSPAPAKGANSFTMGEAKSRFEKHGFSNVNNLTKDDNGVWRGSAQKGGSSTAVWLDYKGNIGEGN